MSASKDYFKKAEQAAKKGNFEYAIELFMQGLMIDPKSVEQRGRMHHVMSLAIQEKGGNPQGASLFDQPLLQLKSRVIAACVDLHVGLWLCLSFGLSVCGMAG